MGGTIADYALSLGAGPLQLAALDKALLQFRASVRGRGAEAATDVHAVAASGAAGGASTLPHREKIQCAFGYHDISHVEAYTGPAADAANRTLGARAFACGEKVVLSDSGQDLHTVAHEAAHVVQQRGGVSLKGGVGQPGDRYEHHADAVADLVVRGQNAAPLLDEMAGAGGSSVAAVQLKGDEEGEHDKDVDGEEEDAEAGSKGFTVPVRFYFEGIQPLLPSSPLPASKVPNQFEIDAVLDAAALLDFVWALMTHYEPELKGIFEWSGSSEQAAAFRKSLGNLTPPVKMVDTTLRGLFDPALRWASLN